MITIENDYLKAAFKTKGAELSSLIEKTSHTECIWQADPSVWAYHAPILFPIVGGLKLNTLHVDGKTYPLNRHGFARISEFEVEVQTKDSVTFLLKSSDLTHAVFPYEFEFRMKYSLNGESLKQEYIVKNTDTKPIFFALGGHTGFRVPLSTNEIYSDYWIEFEQSEHLNRYLINSEGLFTDETEPVLVYGNKIPLSYDLFSSDALIFKQMESRSVQLKSAKSPFSIKVDFPDFPYLGIWAKSGADFVCIEPWIGCADHQSGHKDISEKEFIQDIDAGESFSKHYLISINR
ncbi:aldose 1-epimerase family protein [bacterium]|nr:MAG: aldose 1-epimerase family protein [bacterium]